MMSPELRQQLIDYRAACAEQLAGFRESQVVVAPEAIEILQRLIGLLDDVLALDDQTAYLD